jgi:hypothetical protein
LNVWGRFDYKKIHIRRTKVFDAAGDTSEVLNGVTSSKTKGNFMVSGEIITANGMDIIDNKNYHYYFHLYAGVGLRSFGINWRNMVLVKRLQLNPQTNEIAIKSDNSKYDSLVVFPDEIRIEGKVIWYGRELR